jgi:acetate kinase
MGFSALDGVPMGTRCGALDPGAIIFMLRDIGMTIGEVERLLYTKSGLLGLSGVSNDMRALRQAAAQQDANARLAIDHFTYRIRREIGSLAAAMGGVDAIVFTAGIGENDVATRAEVLEGLSWLGFELDRAANDAGGPRITRPGGRPAFVLPTSEEIVIARQIRACLGAHAATAALA